MFINIKDSKAVLDDDALALPLVRRVYSRDKVKGKSTFETWMRFIYYSYNKESIYRNYLPRERELKVVEALFPDKCVTYFKSLTGMKALIEFYIESSYTFKELLYRRLLNDVEVMMDKLSKVELTKTVRIKQARDITFFSKSEKKEVTENINIDTRISIDNSEEKLKAMDTLDKLLKREVLLKKALKEEQIEAELTKARAQRMFDM